MSKAPAVKKRSAWKKFYESYKAYLYLAPAILVMLVFVLYPLVKVFRMGFYTKYNYLTEVGKGFGDVYKRQNQRRSSLDPCSKHRILCVFYDD